MNWKQILASAPRSEIPVQRKRMDFVFTLGLELGVKDGGVVAPGGIVPTHQRNKQFRVMHISFNYFYTRKHLYASCR